MGQATSTATTLFSKAEKFTLCPAGEAKSQRPRASALANWQAHTVALQCHNKINKAHEGCTESDALNSHGAAARAPSGVSSKSYVHRVLKLWQQMASPTRPAEFAFVCTLSESNILSTGAWRNTFHFPHLSFCVGQGILS